MQKLKTVGYVTAGVVGIVILVLAVQYVSSAWFVPGPDPSPMPPTPVPIINSLGLPNTASGEVGRLVTLKASRGVVWVVPPDFPGDFVESSNTISVVFKTKQRAYIGAFADNVPGKSPLWTEFNPTDPGPTPGPTPGPGPKPPIPPAPTDPYFPLDGKIRVLIVYESSDKTLTVGQRAAIEGIPVRKWLDAHCSLDEGRPGYAIWDEQTDITQAPQHWQKASQKAKAAQKQPFVLASNGKGVEFIEALPKDDVLPLLKKVVGE